MFRSKFHGVLLLVSATTLLLAACHSSSNAPNGATDSAAAKDAGLSSSKSNPEFRTSVKKEPVAEYKVRTADTLNEMYFSVRLYETSSTMKYLAKVEFEGLPGEDTIRLPDLGTPPQPVLQKGPEKYSCIIGFLDNDKQFRELKKVYVKDEGKELKITTLKHYALTDN